MTGAVFEDRTDAGRQLGEVLKTKDIPNPLVVAIPRGGVPVGVQIARALSCPLKLVVLRKLFIPSEPEAGFGAMAPDGTVLVDHEWVAQLGLSTADVDAVVRQVRAELRRRRALYPCVSAEDVRDRDVILTDDGIAAGYSMCAAARYVGGLQPRSLRVAVPCAPAGSLERIRPLVQEIVCLVPSKRLPFAVAGFYRHWHDLTDREVQAFLAARTPHRGGNP